MQSSFRRILTGSLFFGLTLLIAVVGYTAFGWSLLDSVYMVVITIFGVGYGEVEPLESPSEKIFTIFVIIAGTSSAVYIVGGFIQMVTEGEIQRALDARRRDKELDTLENHAIICGFGRIGQMLANQLAELNRTFIVLDSDAERIDAAHDAGYWAYLGSASEEDVLERIGIQRAKILATVLPDDALNVFITLTARGLNPDLSIIARGELPATDKKLRLAGADHVVLPAAISAQRIATLITCPTAADFLGQGEERRYFNTLLGQLDMQITEMAIPEGAPIVGKSINQLEVRGTGAFVVVALRTVDGILEPKPERDRILQVGDTVIVMGHKGDIPQFARIQALKRNLRYRGAKIT
ncbi:MAG: potassium channel protein [Cyanobacteria bacterium P01_H01_bin.15]